MNRLVSLPQAEWPNADRLMWSALFATGDLLDGTGDLVHLRDTSRAGLARCYGRWLAWLFESDPATRAEDPAFRATIERILGWIDALAAVAPPTRHTLVYGALHVLRVAAPEQEWRSHLRLLARLRRQSLSAQSSRKSGRILSSVVLFEAASKLTGPLADAATTPLNAALMRRDATVIGLLALLPIRLRSLSELQIGTSMLQSGEGLLVSLSGDMTKNGQVWEAGVAPPLLPLLQRYIEEVRPWLMARSKKQHAALWVGRMGEPLRYKAIADIVLRVTKRLTGVPVSPHLFRDAAATTLARQSPKDALLIRPILGHSSYGIAERHYNHAQGIEAGRDYAAVLSRLMQDD